MKKNAILSDDNIYRYELRRIWEPEKDLVMFVGLNPSIADHKVDDPTIRRCIGYAKDWGYGGLIMCNLFAYRSTNPNQMKKYIFPIGNQNDDYLNKNFNLVDKVICMWGNHGKFMGKGNDFIKKYEDKCYYLEKNNSGEPKHLLYSKKNLIPIKY